MYCPNCGKEVSSEDRFCKYCSHRIDQRAERVHTYSDAPAGVGRSAPLAMLISLVLPGLGAYYIDSDGRGLGIFAFSVLIVMVEVLVPFLLLPAAGVAALLWMYGLYTTSKAIDRYYARTRGR